MERRKDKFYKKGLVMLNGCKNCQNKSCKWNSKVATPEIAQKGREKFGCNTSRQRG